MAATSASAEVTRSLKIKTGVCARLCKEVKSYEEEVKRDEERVAERQRQGADEHDLKQLQEVARESRNMILDCRRKLGAALPELEALLATVTLESSGEAPVPEAAAARDAVLEAKRILDSSFAAPAGGGG